MNKRKAAEANPIWLYYGKKEPAVAVSSDNDAIKDLKENWDANKIHRKSR